MTSSSQYDATSMKTHSLIKIILFFYLFIGLTAEAQILRVGPKGGIQLTRSIYEDSDFQKNYQRIPTLAFHAGMAMNVKVSDIFSLQTEWLYEESRKHIEDRVLPEWQKETYRYLSLPVLLRVSLPAGYNEFFFNAGPRISYWLSGQGEIMHGEVLDFEMETLKYQMIFSGNGDDRSYFINDANRFQLGLDFGIGAIFPMGSQSLMVDIRYSVGHTNMVKRDVKYLPLAFYDDNLQHSQQMLSLSLSYLFNLDFHELSTKGKSTGKQVER